MSTSTFHPFQRFSDLRASQHRRETLLLSDIPPWSAALLGRQAFSPHPKAIPKDVTSSEASSESLWPYPPVEPQLDAWLAEIIDRTTLETHFDASCFDEIDDELLLNPWDSFADMCWMAAVHDTLVTPRSPMRASLRVQTSMVYDRDDDGFSDHPSDETITVEDEELLTPIHPNADELLYASLYKAVYTPDLDAAPINMPTPIPEVENDRSSFVLFDLSPGYSIKRHEPVTDFPVPQLHSRRPTKSNRLAQFIPARLRTGGN